MKFPGAFTHFCIVVVISQRHANGFEFFSEVVERDGLGFKLFIGFIVLAIPVERCGVRD
jgi:hypothetical protein